MSLEWKMKLHSVYGQLLFDRKLTASLKEVKANKGAGGIDGETIESTSRALKKTSWIYLRDFEVKSTSQVQSDVSIFRRKMGR